MSPTPKFHTSISRDIRAKQIYEALAEAINDVNPLDLFRAVGEIEQQLKWSQLSPVTKDVFTKMSLKI